MTTAPARSRGFEEPGKAAGLAALDVDLDVVQETAAALSGAEEVNPVPSVAPRSAGLLVHSDSR